MINFSVIYGLFLGIILNATNCYSANILCIYPAASYSHQQPMLALSHALAEKGHNLTVITPNPSKVPIKNHREIDISFMYSEFIKMQRKNDVSLQTRRNPYEFMKGFTSIFGLVADLILSSPEVKDLIKELKEGHAKYDLIVYESLFMSSLLGFADILDNPPIIGIFTAHPFVKLDTIMGNPTVPSYIPNNLLEYSDKMTLLERFDNLCFSFYFHYLMNYMNAPIQEQILKKHFGELKYTAEEIENNKSLMIYSTDLATGYSRPISPNTIYVGPLHLTKSNPLPKDLQKWMDEAEDGVIYFSLGSNMKGTSFPEEKRSAFIKAFSQFPKVRVLWKWEADTKLPGQPDNVLVKKWLPQQSILAHPKVILFISQVGLQSLQEAVNNVVPVLGVPMFGDQDFNARKVVESKAGLSIEFYKINDENVYGKLYELITNKSFYKKNIRRLSEITKDKPMSSIDTAIWWLEYVIRHNGAPHLRPASLDLTWYQYFMLDIAVILITVVLIIIVMIYKVFKLIFRPTKVSKKKTN